jgi:hypothetical protein
LIDEVLTIKLGTPLLAVLEKAFAGMEEPSAMTSP